MNQFYSDFWISNYDEQLFFCDPAEFKPLVIAADHSRTATPIGFKGTLLQHQEAILRALLELEDSRQVIIRKKNSRGTMAAASDERVIFINSHSCFLSAPVGTGKTLIVLAAIIARPIPKKLVKTNTIYNNRSIYKFEFAAEEGETKFIKIRNKESVILRSSIIVVMPSVFDQWNAEIKKFTDLTVLLISNVVELRRFEKKMISAAINNYDIVLVKNNYITTNKGFTLPEFNNENVSIKSLLYAVTMIVKAADASFAWGIYDDYDSSTPPGDSTLPAALYNIFVSSTASFSNNNIITIKNHINIPNNNIIDMTRGGSNILKNVNNNFYDIGRDNIHMKLFSISCSTSFIKDCVNIPAPIHTMYKIRRNDAWAIAAIGELGAQSVLEMLNSDALETAATAAGLSVASSPIDILKSILDKNYVEYIAAGKIISRLRAWREEYLLKFNLKQNYFHKTESEDMIKSIISSILNNKNRSGDLISWYSSKLLQKIDETIAEKIKARENINNIIERFKANLSDKECPICCNTLENTSIAITKCCSLPLCSICITNSGKFVATGNKVEGQCPQCRSILNFPKDMIVISTKKFEEVKTAEIDEAAEDDIIDESDNEIINKLNGNDINKVTAADEDDSSSGNFGEFSKKILKVWDIVLSKDLSKAEDLRISEPSFEENKNLWNLYTSSDVVECPKSLPKKIIIFSNWPECYKYIVQSGRKLGHFDKFKILKLQGGPHQLSGILDEFIAADIPSILFIDGMKYCAGMNIQAATDVIFMHKIHDQRIAAQVIGRTTRIGRKFSARIHSLLYDLE